MEPNLQTPLTWYMQHMLKMGLEGAFSMNTFHWSVACLSMGLGL